MQVNSVHKIEDVQDQLNWRCYVKSLIGSLTILVLTWLQLDIANSIRAFFAPLLNTVQ